MQRWPFEACQEWKARTLVLWCYSKVKPDPDISRSLKNLKMIMSFQINNFQLSSGDILSFSLNGWHQKFPQFAYLDIQEFWTKMLFLLVRKCVWSKQAFGANRRMLLCTAQWRWHYFEMHQVAAIRKNFEKILPETLGFLGSSFSVTISAIRTNDLKRNTMKMRRSTARRIQNLHI